MLDALALEPGARGHEIGLRSPNELLHDGSAVRVTMVQLPGLNTPQFTWVRTTPRRQRRPVPPVYSPEVAADAILQAATTLAASSG